MDPSQPSLFAPSPALPSALPEGLAYRPGFISAEEERALAQGIAALELRPFEFQNYLGKRRVTSFGWRYVFDGSGLQAAESMPDFLLPLRARAAKMMGVEAETLAHVLLTEYAPGAGIGWHRDRPVFGDVVGISLLAPARLRFRRKAGAKWERLTLEAQPRSAYLLRGPARHEWEHSIPEMEALRYSITFRTLKDPARS
jgi:alkylated DNA repair dioxygenase AlkB